MIAVYRTCGLALAFSIAAANAIVAETLPQPTGEVVLTVTGDIGVTNQGNSAVFDAAMLQALGEVSFDTTTPWTEGTQTFTGLPLHALMEALGVGEGTLVAKAVNDYSIEIPVTDAVEGGPIVAYLHNGKTMSVREKGPLWVVYPYDLNPDYQAEVIFSRSIWQLVSIEVKSN